jgi:hypothetical protein
MPMTARSDDEPSMSYAQAWGVFLEAAAAMRAPRR